MKVTSVVEIAIYVIRRMKMTRRRMSDSEKIDNLLCVLITKKIISESDKDFVRGNITESEWLEKEEDS